MPCIPCKPSGPCGPTIPSCPSGPGKPWGPCTPGAPFAPGIPETFFTGALITMMSVFNLEVDDPVTGPETPVVVLPLEVTGPFVPGGSAA